MLGLWFQCILLCYCYVIIIITYVCMYKNLFRAAAYSLGCLDGTMIDRRLYSTSHLYRTFQSLTVNRTETVTSICRKVSVAMSSKVLGQSTRNFVVHSDYSDTVAKKLQNHFTQSLRYCRGRHNSQQSLVSVSCWWDIPPAKWSLWIRPFLVHGQVTIIFVVSVCLFVCLFVCAEFFSAVFDPIWIKLGNMLHVRV